MSTYNTIGSDPLPSHIGHHQYMDRPLFGQPTIWDRALNWVAIGFIGVFVLVTLLGAFINASPIKGINIFFAVCITLSCLSHNLLLYWYRQGDVDPKFRFLIIVNIVTIILSCICANLYTYWLR